MTEPGGEISPPGLRFKEYSFFTTAGDNVLFKQCSAGACTWRNILYRLQVWNLSPTGGQIMHAADCKNLLESPEGGFSAV